MGPKKKETLVDEKIQFNVPFPQLVGNVMKFKPISLSDMDPPIQILWAHNPGNEPLAFSIDTNPFQKLLKENYNHAVIACLTSVGVIPPKSWFPIKLRFSPLEFNEYSVPLRIFPEFAEKPIVVILHGTAMIAVPSRLRPDPVTLPEKARMSDLVKDNFPVTLRPTVLTFPHFVPTGQKTNSVVFLTNMHPQSSITFFWPEFQIEGGGVIKFQPQCGKIGPKEVVTVKVLLEAGNVAACFSTILECILEDEKYKGKYKDRMEQWKSRNDYINNDPYLSQKKCYLRAMDPPEPPKPFVRLLRVSMYIGSVFGLYDTIPQRELSRMPSSQPIAVNRPVESNPDLPSGLVLSKLEREISEWIISNLLLDMMSSPKFEGCVRQWTKREPPAYEEYKNWEEWRQQSPENREEEEQATDIPQQLLEEVLESVMLSLIREFCCNYMNPTTRDKWFNLTSSQPTWSINAERGAGDGPQE